MNAKTNTAAVEFTAADFDKIIAAIVKGQAKTAKDIGKALLGALYFANGAPKKSADAANALVGALRKSTKQTGIIDLLQAMGNLAWTKDRRFEWFEAGNTWTPEEVKLCREVCEDWESWKPAPAKKDVDVLVMVDAISKKVASAKKNHCEVAHEALLALLTDAVAKYTASLDGEIQAEKAAA